MRDRLASSLLVRQEEVSLDGGSHPLPCHLVADLRGGGRLQGSRSTSRVPRLGHARSTPRLLSNRRLAKGCAFAPRTSRPPLAFVAVPICRDPGPLAPALGSDLPPLGTSRIRDDFKSNGLRAASRRIGTELAQTTLFFHGSLIRSFNKRFAHKNGHFVQSLYLCRTEDAIYKGVHEALAWGVHFAYVRIQERAEGFESPCFTCFTCFTWVAPSRNP